MNCEKVIAKLREKFTYEEPPRWSRPAWYNNRVIIFWYDADRNFEECLEWLEIDWYNWEPVKVLKHKSYLRTKHTLEVEDCTSNYLVYLPVAYPDSPENNWLLDIESYSSRFYADALAFGMEECGIQLSDELAINLLPHSNFFSSQQRKKKFATIYSLQEKSDDKTKQLFTIQQCMIASTLWCNHAELWEVLLKLFVWWREENDNESRSKLDKLWLAEPFWKRCSDYLWYTWTQELLDVWKSLFFTTFHHEVQLDKAWFEDDAQHIVDKKWTLHQKLLQWRISHQRTQELYEEIITTSEPYLQWDEYVSRISRKPTDAIWLSLHMSVDKIILSNIQQQLLSDERERNKIADMIHKRKNISLWFSQHEHPFKAFLIYIQFKEKLSSGNNSLTSVGTAKDLRSLYTTSLYEIDQLYRQWLFHMDESQTDAFKELGQLVDREYNKRVKDLNESWNKMLEYQWILEDWKLDTITSQQHFREKQVLPSVAKWSSYSKVFVIISDGMRYEIAQQLSLELQEEARWDTVLESMVGVVPSYTQLWMTALLPYEKLGFYSKDNKLQKIVTNNDKSITWIEWRNKLLQLHYPKSIAVDWDKFSELSNQEQRDALKDKEIVYLYYDEIDKAWEHDEHSLPQASQKTIEDLKSIINRAGNHLNYTHILITADHWFLYNRWALESTDLATRNIGDNVEHDGKRFWIATTKTSDADINVSLWYLWIDWLYCFSPRADLRYKKQWKVPQYVHGWVAIQEVCVPILKYTHKKAWLVKDDVYDTYTKIHIVKIPKTITTNSFKLTVMQDEIKSEKMKSWVYNIYIRNESSKKKVTNVVTITADSISQNAEDRTRKEPFTLVNDSSESYQTDQEYSLVIEPQSSKIWNIEIHPLKISIWIRNDFL